MRFGFNGLHHWAVIKLAMLGVISALSPAVSTAQVTESEEWNAKFQATYVWQSKRAFSSPYSSTNSLSSDYEQSYSFTSTIALGFRPWAGGEFYFNPEFSEGVPLSNLTGLGGFTNGEIARTAGPNLTLYRARMFLRQTWGMGGGTELMESDANQLAGPVDKNRWVLTAGNLSVIDIFDDNAYNHDPRTQFMNWSLMTHGAYDYAADARGYSWGVALERYQDNWAFRIGRFIQPKEPNQLDLDPNIFTAYGDQIEVERGHTIHGRPGKVRFLAFMNKARMSRFQDAINLGVRTGSTPDINNVRTGDQIKRGYGLNLEQELSQHVGVFARASWADGQTETYAFTEIDRSTSAGMLIKGSAWNRGQDSVGFAFARNELSSEHRVYLAAGGMGFFIGDGSLNYQPENIFEAFYSLGVAKGSWITLDWQHIRNPAYNADRSPVNVMSVRLHTEF